jgi:hypothetical protein
MTQEEKKSEAEKLSYEDPKIITEVLDTAFLMVSTCNGMTADGVRKDAIGPCQSGSLKT